MSPDILNKTLRPIFFANDTADNFTAVTRLLLFDSKVNQTRCCYWLWDIYMCSVEYYVARCSGGMNYTSRQPGSTSGLRLGLYINEHDYFYANSPSAGFRVSSISLSLFARKHSQNVNLHRDWPCHPVNLQSDLVYCNSVWQNSLSDSRIGEALGQLYEGNCADAQLMKRFSRGESLSFWFTQTTQLIFVHKAPLIRSRVISSNKTLNPFDWFVDWLTECLKLAGRH